MNYAKEAYEKVSSLEAYVNTLASRISTNKPQTVVFYVEPKTLSTTNNIFEFQFDTNAETTLSVDISVTISGLNGSISALTSTNGIFTDLKTFSSNGVCCFRLASSFTAEKGENILTLTMSCSSSCSLTSMTVVANGLNLLEKRISHVSGSFNATYQQWTVAEARNGMLYLMDSELTSKNHLKTFDGLVDKFLLYRVNGSNFAFVIIKGVLMSVACTALASTLSIATSVSDMAIGESDGVCTMFLVCRNRLYQTSITNQQKKLLPKLTQLNKEEKVTAVRCSTFQNSFALCVETSNKVSVYLCQKENFQLLSNIGASGLNCCFFDGQNIFLTCTSGNLTVLRKLNLTGQIISTQNLGNYDSVFQYAPNTALVSKDNQLTTISLQ